MGSKKKLHLLNPLKGSKKIQVHKSKREVKTLAVTVQSIEREVREYLSKKLSGIYLGLWLLIPEHLRIGSWDLLKMWSHGQDYDLNPRMAMQLVNEAALCVNGQRPVRSLSHQGFELANGLPFLCSDTSIHELLSEHTVNDSIKLQIALAKLRLAKGHYASQGLLAIDPHRIHSFTRRIMPAKKKDRNSKSEKIMQTFFCIDAITGQPLVSLIGSSSTTASTATLELFKIIKSVFPEDYSLTAMADCEHATGAIINEVLKDQQIDIIMPIAIRENIKAIMKGLNYERQWAGYALGESDYKFESSTSPVKLLVERTGEVESEYTYKPFITTGEQDPLKLLGEDFPKRWTIEEFFNFESAMGWDRASTMNLNIRYGKMSLALIAQAAAYQLRKKLPAPYKSWTAKHLADSVFRGIEGDLRVRDDILIVTYYNFPENLNLRSHYEKLPQKLISEGIDPRIPWLYNFKLDFRFK